MQTLLRMHIIMGLADITAITKDTGHVLIMEAGAVQVLMEVEHQDQAHRTIFPTSL